MADQKIRHALNTGATHIISTDLSCLMHLQGIITKTNIPLTTMHIADVLASGWERF
jgi:L-lactate dehydrogenase complex protein LldE